MHARLGRSLGMLGLAFTLCVSGAALADDLLLRVDGVRGESTRQRDEIDISSFSWGFSQPDASGRGTGAAAARAAPERFVVKKFVDAASPAFVQHLLDGRAIKSATFVVRRSGGGAKPTIQIDLTNVRVVDVQVTGSDSGRPTETVSFTFSKLSYQYFPLDKAGNPGPAVVAIWDQAGLTR